MRRGLALSVLLFGLASGCGKTGSPPERTGFPDDTSRITLPMVIPVDTASTTIDLPTTTGEPATTATSPAGTGTPSPPGGYAVVSRPMEGDRLAVIEYVSPGTVAEIAEFYDSRVPVQGRVRIEVPEGELIVYTLARNTVIVPSATLEDVRRLMDLRNEPLVVVEPWRIQTEDPLIGDLRSVGQQEQAESLLATRSRIVVVYAVR